MGLKPILVSTPLHSSRATKINWISRKLSNSSDHLSNPKHTTIDLINENKSLFTRLNKIKNRRFINNRETSSPIGFKWSIN